LIRRGGCPYVTKIVNAASAGARAIIIYNNEARNLIGELTSPIPNFDALTISASDGQFIIRQLRARGNGEVTLSLDLNNSEIPVEDSGTLADFTSWGLSPDFFIKVSIALLNRYVIL
jgi:hypothetical protein